MRWDSVYIPFGGYWSSPFAKWQGAFSSLHALRFAADVAKTAMKARGLEPTDCDALYLGTTVPQPSSFYGAPWLAGMIGAPEITGPTISQACATSARVIASAANEVASGTAGCVLTISADRTSNGPHLSYPNPLAPGGKPDVEDWVWDNFSVDPWAKNSMLETAENVAREANISRAEQDEVALLRYEQYQAALADDREFLRRFMVLPYEITDRKGRVVERIEGDEGVFATTKEGLEKLKPVVPGGTVTFGTQTYPADGNAAIIVTNRERAAAFSRDTAVTVRVCAAGEARVAKGYMAKAVVPAARQALSRAEIGFGDLAAIKTHNPFAVNDVYFARETGVSLDAMNRFGCSLIWGHPQGPTGTRLTIELIEELAASGGGYGLFAGCAAGDTAMALVVHVDVAG